jgi:hypothetical protein
MGLSRMPMAHDRRDHAAIDRVAIADEVERRPIPRKCLGYLTCNPFCRGICCYDDPDKVSAVEPDNDEGIEKIEIGVGGPCRRCPMRDYARRSAIPWLDGPRRMTTYLPTLDCAPSNPSSSSSP